MIFSSFQKVAQMSSSTEFHHEEHLLGARVDLEQAHRIRVLDIFQKILLSLISPQNIFPRHIDYFDRISVIVIDVFSYEDFRGGSTPEQGLRQSIVISDWTRIFHH